MKSPRHIIRSIAAVMLLGIFISIHVVKAFHTHQPITTSAKSQDAAEHVKASTDCTVCDYHFTKDGFSEIASIESIVNHFYVSTYPFYQSHISSSIGLHYSDRGPPALV